MHYLLLTLLILSSCSQINTEEQELYKERKEFFRHGIVPIPLDKIESTNERRILNKEFAIKGKDLYQKNCMECHGLNANGKGPRARALNPPPKDLVEIVRAVPNFKFYMMMSKWTGKMPGWKNLLTDQEILYIENCLIELAQN